jgi:hypothetical protein
MDWLPAQASVRRAGAEGRLLTRPLTFSGSHLFVNADVTGGELRVEVLDAQGVTIEPFSRQRCEPITGDGTRQPVRWREASLATVAGREVRLRFTLTGGRLFSFWVSTSATGESGGYTAAGGPAFAGPRDSRDS